MVQTGRKIKLLNSFLFFKYYQLRKTKAWQFQGLSLLSFTPASTRKPRLNDTQTISLLPALSP